MRTQNENPFYLFHVKLIFDSVEVRLKNVLECLNLDFGYLNNIYFHFHKNLTGRFYNKINSTLPLIVKHGK